MRLFVAVALGPTVADRLDDALAPLRERHPGLRWTPPSSWHVTLAFLGAVDVSPDEVATLVGQAVAAIPGDPPRLRLGSGGRFGPKVLWVGVADQPQGRLGALADAIQRILHDAGLLEDTRPLQAHVTVARAKGSGGRLPAGIEAELAVPDQPSWAPDAVHVYSSQTRPEGAVYTVEASVPLA